LKYAQFRKDAVGENWEIFYLRDKESREVDFVVTFNRRVHWLIVRPLKSQQTIDIMISMMFTQGISDGAIRCS
jgi:hypothetical protein